MTSVIRRPTLLDTFYIAENARQADKEECYLLSGKPLMETFNETEGLYLNSWVWEVDGKVICIYGVTPWEDKKGVIWFVATDEFDKRKDTFRVFCKEIVGEMSEGYDYLFNYVHTKHKKAIKWLKWLGFKLLEPEPIGLNGEMFCKFEVSYV